MLSTEECKVILSSKGNKYSDEEVEQIREFLYNMARVSVEEYQKPTDDEKEAV